MSILKWLRLPSSSNLSQVASSWASRSARLELAELGFGRKAFANEIQHFALVGKLAGVQFGIHQLVIEFQLEAAAAGRNQRQAGDALLIGFHKLGRQTDGLGLVISERAIT